MSETVDTTSPSGLSYILQETVLALIRHPEYAEYAFATSQQFRDGDRAEARFNELSLSERGKFKKETVSNVQGRKSKMEYSAEQGPGNNDLLVITLLVAAEGSLALPNIVSVEDLKTVLSKLGGVSQDSVMAVEVLWTPSSEEDHYSKEDMLVDYPNMVNL